MELKQQQVQFTKTEMRDIHINPPINAIPTSIAITPIKISINLDTNDM